jgi:hypothetical protein
MDSRTQMDRNRVEHKCADVHDGPTRMTPVYEESHHVSESLFGKGWQKCIETYKLRHQLWRLSKCPFRSRESELSYTECLAPMWFLVLYEHDYSL